MQVHLGAALVRQYGEPAKKFFSIEEQARIAETTWTEEGIPQARVDVELNEVLEEVEAISWINTDALEELETEGGHQIGTDAQANAQAGVLDTDSVSTFGSRLISPAQPLRPN